MNRPVRYIVDQSQEYRNRYGTRAGLWLWYLLRSDYKSKKGSIYEVKLPGVKNPIALRAGTSDIDVLRQLIVHEELSFPLSEKPSFIIDAGANIGLASVYFANRFPRTRILAIEVDASNFAVLETNTRYYKNVIPIQKALWNKPGYVRITNPNDAPWAYRVVEADSADSGAIASTSVKAILEEFRPPEISLLKLDIEGAEKEVFEGDFSDWLKYTRAVAVELHDRLRPGCSASLEAALRGRSYTRSKHGEYDVIYFPEPQPFQ
jgi:FkbM family methyltransferase